MATLPMRLRPRLPHLAGPFSTCTPTSPTARTPPPRAAKRAMARGSGSPSAPRRRRSSPTSASGALTCRPPRL
uniref:Uncharacterized protein n=1 Tax=Arundo donax TaxID=35708 RepID=A0A0A9B6C9_ARUDO